MRVLHIYAGNLYGGVETLLVTLAQNQALCPDMELEFCLCFDGRLKQELSASAKTYLLNPARLRKPWTVWSARQKLKRILKTGNFDVVVCHSSWCQTLFGPVVRRSGIPLVFSLHDATDGRHWLERMASRVKPNLIISNSKFTTATADSIYPGIKTKVIYWPVAPAKSLTSEKRQEIRRDLGVNETETVIIQVSRLEQWKGHLLHLEALAKLRHIPGWVCWMVGGPQRAHEHDYYEFLQQKTTELGLAGRVRFLGQRTDVEQLLAAADIHCQPNMGPEPFGRTFIEALNAGLPVVTTRMGAAVEIVDNSCGILVEPNDAAALSKALDGFIENAAKRQGYRSSCLARAKALCDPQAQMDRFAHTLQELVSA